MKQSFRVMACSSTREQTTWLDVYHSVKDKQFDKVKCILVNIYGKDIYRKKIGYNTLQRLCCTINQIERRSVAKRNHFLDRSSSCVLAIASIAITKCHDERIVIQKHEVDVLLSICTNNAEELEELLTLDNSLEDTAVCCKGVTPIHFAVLWENIESLNVLLKFTKTDLINQKDLYGFTALHYAVQSQSVTATRLLLQSGADTNAQLQDGKTPLHVAAYHVIPQLVLLLCQHDADTKAVNTSGETSLIMATRSENKSHEHHELLTTISLLLRFGSSPNAHDHHGRTPVFNVLCYCEDPRCALMLCAAGADLTRFPVNIKNSSMRILNSAPRSNGNICCFIEKIKKVPLRLDVICLMTVRTTMGQFFPYRVKDLPLTKGLKKMLLFQALPKIV